MTIDLDCVGSFIFGFLCAIAFLFCYAACVIGKDADDD